MSDSATSSGICHVYYSDETTDLIHGDCLLAMREMPSGGIDLVFTSPPYNLGASPWPMLGNWKPTDGRGSSKWNNGSNGGGGITYADHDDTMPWPEYVAWQHEVLRECWRLLSDRGAIFYNHKPRVVGGRLWTPFELNPDLPVRQIVTWARAGGLNYNATAYVPTYEWIIILAKDGFRLRNQAASGVGDVWRVPQESDNPHPAPFPVSLPARAIETIGPASVLDPFAGSGTTLVAAKAAGARAFGIEKSAAYCDLAVGRLSQGAFDFGPAV